MAFAIVSEQNLYNETVEELAADDRARRGLSQGFGGDLANKAFGTWHKPQFTFVCTTTTAADTGSFVTNLATATRSVNDSTASPSNQLTRTIGPLAGIATNGVCRPMRVRVKQFVDNTHCNIFWFQAVVMGGATPTVLAPAAANLTQLGTRRAADDNVVFTPSAASLLVTVTHGTGNASITWTIEVYTDDPM